MATPLLPLGERVTAPPKSTPSILNWTVPVGAVKPLAGETVAVKVTGWPNVDGSCDDVTAVVVAVEAKLAVASPDPLASGLLKQMTLPTLLKTVTLFVRLAVVQLRKPAGGPCTVNLNELVLALMGKLAGVARVTDSVELLVGAPEQFVAVQISLTNV